MARSPHQLLFALRDQLNRVVLGKPEQVQLSLTCLAAGGHLLLEDVPGLGKTTLAESLALSFSLSFGRIQFTADMLPADILGSQVFLAKTDAFEFRRGPIFHHMVLADELNRAPPRTQSALLEAMAQGQVTIDGTTHPLPDPFVVIATQNPTDLSGTYPLPDSQLDRFLMRLTLGHLDAAHETALVKSRQGVQQRAEALATAADLTELRRFVERVRVADEVAEYAVRLAQATRVHPDIERGISTRAVLSLMNAAKAFALWSERDFVSPGDVRSVWSYCLSHRVVLRSAVNGTYSRDEARHVLDELVQRTPSPS